MPDPAIQSINQHTQKTSLDWLFNILVQPSSGTGSGVDPATHEQYGLSLDLLRQALVEVGNVVNNITTTVPGKVLDARQGKVLADTIQAEIAKYAQPNGIATLGSDGKVPASQIPSLALVDVYPVASQAAMLASGAEQGDMAIRSDTSQVFILSASPASTLENWIELSALKALVDTALDAIKGDGWDGQTLVGLDTKIDTNRLYSDSQYLALKAKYEAQQIALNASKAELYTDDPILQYGAVENIGDGYEADDTPIDVSANVVDGKLSMEQKGLTITNLVKNGDFSQGTTGWTSEYGSTHAVANKILTQQCNTTKVNEMEYQIINLSAGTFVQCRARVIGTASILQLRFMRANGTYFTVGNVISNPVSGTWYILSAILTEDTTKTGVQRMMSAGENVVLEIDGNYGVSAYNLTTLGLSTITDTAILAKLLPYVDGTKSVGKMGIQILDADDAVTQTIFLPAIGNSLPNGVVDSIKTVSDGWEHSKRVSTPASVGSGVAVNTTNYPTAKNGGQWANELTAGGTEIGVVGTDSTTGAGMLRFELATPVTTHYDLPHPTSGKTIHRFAGEEKIALYGTGLTFSENVLSVLSAVKFVAGVMTDITSLATITTNTVTFSGVNATDVVYVKVEHDVDRPLGVLEHTPAVSNTASRLLAIENWIAAQEEA